MRLSLKCCKDNGAHHPLHEVTKPCGQSHGEQFRDTAAGADEHAFLPSLSEDRCVPMLHRKKESRCLPQERSLVVQKARVFPWPEFESQSMKRATGEFFAHRESNKRSAVESDIQSAVS